MNTIAATSDRLSQIGLRNRSAVLSNRLFAAALTLGAVLGVALLAS